VLAVRCVPILPGRPCHIVREGHAYYTARVHGSLAFRLWKSRRCFKVLERVNERIPVTQKIVLLMVCFAVALRLFAQNKMSKRLSESTAVLKTILDKQDIPKSILDN
jgi:hypothetical protein